MTSKQRIMTALNRGQADRVPVSTYALHPFNKRWWQDDPSYADLLQFVGEHCDTLSFCGVKATGKFFTAADVPATRRVWREGEAAYTEEVVTTPLGELRTVWRRDDGVDTTWTIEHLLKTPEDVDRFLSIPFEPVEVDATPVLECQREVGDHGIAYVGCPAPFCETVALFDFEDFAVYCHTDPDLIARLVDALAERIYDWLRKTLEAGAGPLFRICGPEYATPPLLPRHIFERFVVPYDRHLINLMHKYDCYGAIHCHGKVASVLDLIIATGADMLEPLEPPPDGDITLADLKRRAGAHLCLTGYIEWRDLDCAKPGEMREKVKQACEQGAPGGGFMLAPSASPIVTPLPDRTKANYYEYIEAALEFGRYG